MKLTTLLFFVALFQVSASSYAQTKLSLKFEKETLESVFSKIEASSEFSIFYKNELIKDSKEITGEYKDASVNEILDQILKSANLSYTIKGKLIMIVPIAEPEKGNNDQQQKSVSGKVTDNTGAELPGVSVVVKGTTTGVITDMDGKYTLPKVPENATLQFSFVGMKTQEVTVGTKSTINITLDEDAIGIEEVVAIGYGTVKKSDLTGAVSVVKTNDLQTSASPSIGSMLQGRASGLQVTQNSAQPGGDQSFLIRGASSVNASNAPLWVIDGIPYSGGLSEPGASSTYSGGGKSILNSLNPNDIESIEVLKDASSTAIYGARASSGVVLITTKKGKEGKTQVQYSGSYSFQNIADTYEVMDASTHMTQANRYLKEDWMRKNKVIPYGSKTESDIAGQFVPKYSKGLIDNPPVNTNWLDEVTQTGYTTQHNLTLSGGSKNLKHFISGNYYKQEGVIRTNGMERFTGRVNLEYNLNKYLAAGINVTASQSNFDNVPLGSWGNESSGIIRAAIHATPMQQVRDADGNYPRWPEASFIANPASLQTVTDKGVTSQLLAIAFIKLNPIENLTFKFNVGLDKGSSTRNQYIPRTTMLGFSSGGNASIGTKFKTDKTFDFTADYKFKLGENHNLNVMAGTSAQYFSWEGSNLSNYGFLLDNSLWYNIGSGSAEKPKISSNGGTSSVASYFGRANYSLLDRYLITGTFRADGASNFAKNHKWGYFPSASFAWKIHNEAFMEPIKNIVSQLKLRAGYGLTGNSSIGNRSFASYGSSVNANPVIGEKQPTAVYAIQLENPDLKWESSKELNIGLDFGFLDNKISGSIEYFNKTTFDLLATRSLLSYNEVNTIVANIGKTQSTGFELSLSTVLDKGDFKWNTSSTFSLYRDRWKERDPAWKPGIYEKPNDFIRTMFSYLSDGLIQIGENVPQMPGGLPGQVKIKDIGGYQLDSKGNPMVDANGNFINTGVPDGKINGADMANLGSSDPKFRIGFSNTFAYKKFDLNIYFYGVFGKTLANPLLSDYWDQISNLGIGKNYPTAFIVDSWTRDNPNGKYPSFFRNTIGYGDYFNEPGWFIRCQNITLGYNLTLPKLNISNIHIFSSLQNPFVITDYKGVDPETDTYAASYPNIRTLTFGVDVKF